MQITVGLQRARKHATKKCKKKRKRKKMPTYNLMEFYLEQVQQIRKQLRNKRENSY